MSSTLDLVLQICKALVFLHNNNIIHRDIKPSNIIVKKVKDNEEYSIKNKDGLFARLMDFGLAKPLGDKTPITTAGEILGSPGYIAPEQALGRKVDKRTDLYAIGVLIYELTSKHRPFEGLNPIEMLTAHIRKKPRLPSTYIKKYPSKLEQIIMKLLEKKPLNRYQSVEELINDLEELENTITNPSLWDTIKNWLT